MAPRWFDEHDISPGVIISLQSRWRIVSQEEEEYVRQGSPSYACILLKVRQVGSKPPVYGNMRIYKQIPTENTIGARSEVRAKQAQAWIPFELKAYRQLMFKNSTFTPKLLDSMEESQDAYSLVPGGFIVWVVFQEVSGIRLGDEVGEDTFWSMEPSVREQIRTLFKENYMTLGRWGWIPLHLLGKDLVWDPESLTLFFVNWFMPTEIVSPEIWEDGIFYSSGLLKPPATPSFSFQRWNGSVKGWQG
ncbi:hypothetical protein ASPBRDRAFT_167293 [Aspergillus brasiliensis CBS 101740]|uniref:Uncharacterized protein n=1 Tax=Aspergillus brasiliensis (strain CBS 101740 / IMI 381727 / IBT 21946) TaxID=767769 RepID=A0A1L9V231_ASPBC|nr:hypothetical protein ASPBRDRAFT_167293 [Aspergillus brasiliensis CBS 101740]